MTLSQAHEPTDAPPVTPEQVFHEYGPRVYSLARRMTGNDADAEDVTQEVLLSVVRRLDTFRGEASVSTWLHRITVNVAATLGRKRATRREARASDPAGDGWDGEVVGRSPPACPRQQAEGRELSGLIEGAIRGLPSPYREVCVLSDVESLSHQEISDRLGLNPGTVKSRLHRARMMLRDTLAPQLGEVVA